MFTDRSDENKWTKTQLFLSFCRHVQQLQAETQQLRQCRQERSEEQTEKVHHKTSFYEDSPGERPHQRFLLFCLRTKPGPAQCKANSALTRDVTHTHIEH